MRHDGVWVRPRSLVKCDICKKVRETITHDLKKINTNHQCRSCCMKNRWKIKPIPQPIWSVERRSAHSERLRNRIISSETRKKISLIHTGKKLSEEAKAKISLSSKGRFTKQE